MSIFINWWPKYNFYRILDAMIHESCENVTLKNQNPVLETSFQRLLVSSFFQSEGKGYGKGGGLGLSLFQPATSLTLLEYRKFLE